MALLQSTSLAPALNPSNTKGARSRRRLCRQPLARSPAGCVGASHDSNVCGDGCLPVSQGHLQAGDPLDPLLLLPQRQQAPLDKARCLLHPTAQNPDPGLAAAASVLGASDFVRHLLLRERHPCPQKTLAALLLPSVLLSHSKAPALPDLLPDGVKDVLADAVLIIRAAQTETTMSARALADWVLQSCSREAASLATCWVQYAHHNQADPFASRFSELAAQGLGLSLQPVRSQLQGSSNSGLGGSMPMGASRLSPPVFSSSRQQASSFIEDHPRQHQHDSSSGDSQNGNGAPHGQPFSHNHMQQAAARDGSPPGTQGGGENGDDQQQPEDEEAAAVRAAAEAAAIEAAAVAAVGARSSSEEPPSLPLTTTTSLRNSSSSWPLLRPTPPPPRPQPQEAEEADSGGPSARSSLDTMSSTEGLSLDSGDADEDEEEDVEGEGAAGGLQRQLRQLARVATTPMQLVPLSLDSALRDPCSGRPLGEPLPGSSDSSSGGAGGILLPQIGPWVLTNSAKHFPAAEAEVVPLPPQQQQQQEGMEEVWPAVPRMALRLEYVQQRSSLGESALADALVRGVAAASSSSSSNGGSGLTAGVSPDEQGSGVGGPSEGPPAGTAAAATWPALLAQAEEDVVRSQLTLFNNSRTVRGQPGLSTVFVERQVGAGPAAGDGSVAAEEDEGGSSESGPGPSSSSSCSEDSGSGAESPSLTLGPILTAGSEPEDLGSDSSGSGSSSSTAGGAVDSASAAAARTIRIPLRQGAPGLVLRHGDVIIMGPGPRAPSFRVAALRRAPPPAQATAALVQDALQRFAPLPPDATAAPLATGSGTQALQPQQQQQQQQQYSKTAGRRGGGGSQPGWASPIAAAAAAANPGAALAAQLQQLARLARVNLGQACVGYAALMRSNYAGAQGNAYAWIAWAQAAAQLQQPCVARGLFRVAVAVAERGCEAASAAMAQPSGPAAAGAAPPPLPLAEPARGGASQQGGGWGRSHSSGSSMDEEEVGASSRSRGQAGSGQAATRLPPTVGPSAVDPATQATMPLVQALFTWGRFEWQKGKLWGSARHLWRSAAYACACHPAGPQAGGVGVVLHHWASSELERDNVRNARVVLAEALRKCPNDQPLYVLAAGVELAGGDPELAKEFCLRAYEMHRSDKHLYLVWPRVMAALKEYDKARVLFERGLEYHPRNTKIMNAYAKFEAGVGGDPEMARELHRRAMLLDTHSATDMHTRTAFALLEAEAGRLGRARVMLAEGLSRYPRFLPGLLAMAKVQRLRGELGGAQLTLRQAAKCTHAFNVDLLLERAALYRALGEEDLARATEVHCRASRQHQAAKKAGASTQEAWMLYERICRHPTHRAAARRAYLRKVELGWLSAPGVPGPNAQRAGAPFRPLKRTQEAEARARAEAEAAAQAAAKAEAAAAEAAEAARQRQAKAEATSAAVVEAWEEGQLQQQQQQQDSGRAEEEEVAPLSARQRRIRAARALRESQQQQQAGSMRGVGVADAGREQQWRSAGAGSNRGKGGGTTQGSAERGVPAATAQRRRDRGELGQGESSDEEMDVGAPLLPRNMEPEDKD